MTAVDWMVILLIIVPAFPVLATLILVGHWRVNSMSLHERTVIAVRDAVVASAAAALALWRLDVIELPEGSGLPTLATMMLLVSLPSAYWLLLYFRGSFR